MNVAELIPASSAGGTSPTPMATPRRSAQRRYMRSIISAQSAASVPPAPEWISQMASRSSCSPVKSARRAAAARPGGPPRALPVGAPVPLSGGELVEGLDIGEAGLEPLDEIDVVLHA